MCHRALSRAFWTLMAPSGHRKSFRGNDSTCTITQPCCASYWSRGLLPVLDGTLALFLPPTLPARSFRWDDASAAMLLV